MSTDPLDCIHITDDSQKPFCQIRIESHRLIQGTYVFQKAVEGKVCLKCICACLP